MLLLISIERAGIRGTCRAEARMFSPLVRSLTSLPVGLIRVGASNRFFGKVGRLPQSCRGS